MSLTSSATEEDLSEAIRGCGAERLTSTSKAVRSLKEAVAETVAQLEDRLIREALQACGQNQQRAAKMLGLSRQGLIKKMKRYGIK
ncbi:MAG: hypothetical protein HY314_12405 [Acidobacteria bacterium]|nr:hypothetical protein [Acidobacteriota bacterium]